VQRDAALVDEANPEGRLYFYNIETGESRWPPSALPTEAAGAEPSQAMAGGPSPATSPSLLSLCATGSFEVAAAKVRALAPGALERELLDASQEGPEDTACHLMARDGGPAALEAMGAVLGSVEKVRSLALFQRNAEQRTTVHDGGGGGGYGEVAVVVVVCAVRDHISF
jgi:hypothetical protein